MGYMARASLLALVLVTVVPGLARAQGMLTLEQATAEAQARNRSLEAARSSVAEAGSGVQEARSGLFPRITVSESWQRGNQPVFVFSSLLASRQFASSNFAVDALNHPDATSFYRTSVGVEQVLFDGGRRRAASSTAALAHEIATHDAGQLKAEVALAVAEAYGRVLTAQAARRAADAGVESAREDLARTERRRDAGMATDADVLSLRVHAADLEQRAIQAAGDTTVARAHLNHLIGAAIDRDYQVAEPQPAITVTAPGIDRAALITEALASRPLLKKVDAATRLADTVRQGSRSALLPQLAAQASVDVSGTDVNDRASSWLVGGELRWTFSTGGAELARLRASTEAAARARLDRDDARSMVEVDVVSALARLEAARARQIVGRAAVEQARESQRIIRDRFDAGLAGADEVLRASTAVLDAEARRTAAVVDAMVSQALLDRAAGRSR
jgi:outer membrane protein TolC